LIIFVSHSLAEFAAIRAAIRKRAALIAVVCLAWLIAAWLELANAYDKELTWSNRFDLLDDLDLIIGGTIATYHATLWALRRLAS
jgi:hypothetical protein